MTFPPIARRSPAESTATNAVNRKPECPDPKYDRLKVLVADDDDFSRREIVKAVALLGHECRSAKDGLEAWEMHQAERADVILSDWDMPRVDGLELCRRTRVTDDGHYTYFIFLTDFGDKEHLLRGMEAGADDYHAKPVDLDELQARLFSAGRVICVYRKLAEKNSDLRRDSQTSFRAARMDALTEVGNRLRMNEDLDVLWSRAKRYGQRYSIALCDIDEFKKYNDHFGHLAGDQVLRRIAHTLGGGLRQGDGIYRYGGEEFLLILPDQSVTDAAHAVERVRREVERLGISPGTKDGAVTISIGVAELDPSVDETLEGWLGRADAALYRAKACGRNRVEMAVERDGTSVTHTG